MPSVIAGHVLDNARRPVAKVQVQRKGKVITESGPDGFFSVTVAKAEERVALTFAVDGFVPNTRIYNARAASGINGVAIWPIAYRVRFDPARDLDIELGGSRIQIPAKVLTGAGGTSPGKVAALQFTLFDITSAFQRAAAPGDFSGRVLDGSVRRLNSWGIFSGGLHDEKGRPLSVRRGASIALAIRVPPRLVGNTPREVGYFDFDAIAGLWNQLGTFHFSPNTLTYNGTVTSFGGEHNLDDPQDTVCVTLHVQDFLGNAIPNACVKAHGAQYDSYGTANANGDVCLLVQRNASFWAETSGQTVGGSFYSSAPFGQQNFTSPNFSSGAADCGNSDLCPNVGNLIVDYAVGMHGALESAQPIS